jgi:hypothetical protein
VITLTISRTAVAVPGLPLTINDSGTGTYVLVSFGPGSKQRDNSYARSRWLDGGQLVSTRTDIVTMDLAVQVRGSTTQAIIDAAEVLDQALNQYAYTLTQSISGALTTTVYECDPANTSFPYDPILFRAGMGLFSASIPRQP